MRPRRAERVADHLGVLAFVHERDPRADQLGMPDDGRLHRGAAGEPLNLESDCEESPLWTLQLSSPRRVAIGLVGVFGNTVFFGVSFNPVSIPTQYGLLGIDPASSLVFHQSILNNTAAIEVELNLPAAVVGSTLYFQGISFPNGSYAWTSE